MADQTVRIENLPNAGTPAAVALEMWKTMRMAHNVFDDIEKDFDLFRQCLDASLGRKVDLSGLK